MAAGEDYSESVHESVRGRKRIRNRKLWQKLRNKSKKYMSDGKTLRNYCTHKHLRQSTADGSRPREVRPTTKSRVK